ncbi:single-stranded DNA-binding protein [Actinomyces sp. 432]|uniref:single-stranded DNA-binding protein n=1 Tax=Actinomyces sp. 432 TaxID=2057798 RepID=UPI001373A244|nr:single-stranded DNA-binding protein [Actinomyces sp. 432]QHO92364.1 single-stranded DNA-binding protein [Actinomyces sp. 432]
MAHNTVTITGNLAADPELKFTPSGKAVASLTIADTPRRYDQATGQWVDGETLWLRGSLWQEAAENAAESLRKGMRVIATGRLVQRRYTTRDGQDRSVIEMQIDEIGPSLRYARAQVTRNAPRGQQGQPGGQPQQQGGGGWDAPAGGASGDPWATQGGSTESVPF